MDGVSSVSVIVNGGCTVAALTPAWTKSEAAQEVIVSTASIPFADCDATRSGSGAASEDAEAAAADGAPDPPIFELDRHGGPVPVPEISPFSLRRRGAGRHTGSSSRGPSSNVMAPSSSIQVGVIASAPTGA